MVLFLYGEDSYRSRQKLNQIKKRYLDQDKTGLNLVNIDGEDTSFDGIRKLVGSIPFLAKVRLVIIKDLMSKGKNKRLEDRLTEFIKKNRIPRTTILIFYESGKVDKRKKLFVVLNRQKLAQEFKLLDNLRLEKWIREEVEKRKGSISEEAVSKLASFVGSDLNQMTHEIEKLVAYKSINHRSPPVSGKNGVKLPKVNNQCQITKEDVDLLVKAKIDTDIFKLIDALGQKNKERALRFVHNQLDQGAHELYLLKMIIWQFRNLLQIKDLLEQKKSSYEIAQISHIHPYVVRKSIFQLQNFNMDELKEIYQGLEDADIKIKTGKIDGVLALDLLAQEMCS